MCYLSRRSLPYARPSSRVTLLQIPSKMKRVTPDVKVYLPIRDELIVDNGVILKGLTVVVPNSLCKEYIHLLHKGHPGTDATKRRAKDMLYWPSMMLEIDCTINRIY